MPGKGNLMAKPWGLSRYVISTENAGFLCYKTSCHGLLSRVSWSHATGQEVGQEQMPVGLRYKSTGVSESAQPSQFLSCNTVSLAPQTTKFGIWISQEAYW